MNEDIILQKSAHFDTPKIIDQKTLNDQLESTEMDWNSCYRIPYSVVKRTIQQGKTYPDHIYKHHIIWRLWVNCCTDDYYYVSPSHWEYIQRMIREMNYESAKEDGFLD